MEPIFSLPYSEYAVVNEFGKHFKKRDGFSVYVPASRQEKGVDFLLHNSQANVCLRFQVKSSRSYINEDERSLARGGVKYNLWFNNFISRYEANQADFYLLFGLYPKYVIDKAIDAKKEFWNSIVLCFADNEMKELLEQVKTKKEKKPDRFFGVGFDSTNSIYGYRGFPTPMPMTHHLLDRRVRAIKEALTSNQAQQRIASRVGAQGTGQ